MRAVVCRELGPLEQLVIEDRDPLVPGEGQVVIDVRAAGVNYVDGLFCQGKYQIKPPTPFIPGGEVAGTISALGPGVTGLEVGERVLCMTGLGAFAEQVTASALALLPMPNNIEFATAASLIQSYATILFTLTRRTQVAEGEWVLVLGAGGGIGLAAVDVAAALGAHVIAAASSNTKLAAARVAGAEATINYEEEDLKTRARELSGGGVDVVIDPVGGRQSEPALRATKVFGRFCVLGFASGPIPSVPLNQVLLNNRTVIGVDWGAWTMRDPAGNRAVLAQMLEMVGDGRLHPTEPSARPLEQAAAVMSELLDRKITGKVVLVP